MQQLTLQFDGYADQQQSIDVGTTKRCKGGVCHEAIQHFLEGLGKSVTKPSVRKSVAMWLQGESGFFSQFVGESISRLNAICGTVAVVFSFAMVMFAVVIGG